MREVYMFAIVPPMEISSIIHEQRVIFAEEFGYKTALKPPVHITICPSFEVDNIIRDAFEHQMQSIQQWANKQSPFEISLDGFGCFPNPIHPALTINIAENIMLQNMQLDFAAFLRKMKFKKCSPKWNHHITVGYKDIPPQAMTEINNTYTTRSFKASCVCKNIHLWRHNRVNWTTAAIYNFSA